MSDTQQQRSALASARATWAGASSRTCAPTARLSPRSHAPSSTLAGPGGGRARHAGRHHRPRQHPRGPTRRPRPNAPSTSSSTPLPYTAAPAAALRRRPAGRGRPHRVRRKGRRHRAARPSPSCRPRRASPSSPRARRRSSRSPAARRGARTPGRGCRAAGAFAVRAITQGAALAKLREQRIHVALLHRRRRHRALRGRRARGRRPRGAGGPARDRRRGLRLSGQPGRARRDPRTAGHAAGETPGSREAGLSYLMERLLLRPFAVETDFDASWPSSRAPTSRATLHGDPRTAAEVRETSYTPSARRRSSPRATTSASPPARETGEMIGDCSLLWTSAEHRQGARSASSSTPTTTGCGYATGAAAALLALAFDDLRVPRVLRSPGGAQHGRRRGCSSDPGCARRRTWSRTSTSRASGRARPSMLTRSANGLAAAQAAQPLREREPQRDRVKAAPAERAGREVCDAHGSAAPGSSWASAAAPAGALAPPGARLDGRDRHGVAIRARVPPVGPDVHALDRLEAGPARTM